MSAIAAFTDKKAVHLLTDTAAYDAGGVMLGQYSKVATMPHLHAAIAVRGHYALPQIFAAITGYRFATFDDLVAEGADFIEAEFVHIKPICGASHAFELVLVGWSKERDCMEVYTLANAVNPKQTIAGYEPWVFYQFDGGLSAPLPSFDEQVAAGVREGLTPDKFNPARDALPWLNAMRLVRKQIFGVEGATADAVSPVGGRAMVTTITRENIQQRIIHDWGDQVGKVLKVDSKPSTTHEANVIQLSRQVRRQMEREARKGRR